MKNLCSFIALPVLLLLSLPGWPKTPPPSQNVLEAYVRQGLQANLVLKQRNIELQKALNSLEEAKRLFLPSAALSSGYTSGLGGRYIDLPVGNLLNPVYNSLNQLTNTQNFPQIENQKPFFLPQNQFDFHVRTSVALVNPDLYYNRSFQRENSKLKEYEVGIYERELVKNIKTAYYNYLMAQANVRIQENALGLVKRQLETSKKLVDAGSAVPAVVLRSQAEFDAVSGNLAGAQSQASNARNYFNFLLNQEQATPIQTEGFDADAAVAQAILDPASGTQREELNALTQGIALNQLQTNRLGAYWIPRVNSFLDLGNQSTGGLKVNGRSKYYLVGVSLDMPLFAWGTNKLKTKRASYDLEATKLNKQQTEQALTLSVANARNDVASAKAQLTSAQSQYTAARSYHSLAEKAFSGGAFTFLEYLDARTQVTNAEVGLNVAKYRLLQAHAALEREAASYALR